MNWIAQFLVGVLLGLGSLVLLVVVAASLWASSQRKKLSNKSRVAYSVLPRLLVASAGWPQKRSRLELSALFLVSGLQVRLQGLGVSLRRDSSLVLSELGMPSELVSDMSGNDYSPKNGPIELH